MFPRGTKPELEATFLRSGRRFRLGKRRKIVGGRWNPSKFEESECEVESHIKRRGYVVDEL